MPTFPKKFIDIFASFPYKTPLKYVDEGSINKRKINRLIKNNIIKIIR